MISWTEVMIRLALAALLGGIVGLERERKDWAAGLRTHMMVCVGAALSMLVSAFGFEDIRLAGNIMLDPSRVASQVISGIGFIGAGTILFLRQEIIRGLTTASGLWTVAAIGLAAGGGMYFAASLTTAIAILILWGLKPLSRKFFRRSRTHILTLHAGNRNGTLGDVYEILAAAGIVTTTVTIGKEKNAVVLNIRLNNVSDPAMLIPLAERLSTIPGIQQLSWNKP